MKIWHRILLIILSATLATLTFEPYALSHLTLIAWIPFFIALRAVSTRAGFRLGVLQGFLTLAGTLPWLYSVFGTLAPALWFILALFTGLFGALSTLPRIKNSPFILAVIWTGIEYYRCEHFYLSFPWITPGTSFDPNFFTMIIGVYGLTFLIVLGSIMLAQKRYNTGGFILLTIHLFWFDSNRPNIETPLTVALVQNESRNYDNYLIPSKPLKDKADFIVWPEYAINFDPNHQTFALQQIDELLDSRAQLLVAGGETWLDLKNETYSNSAFTFGTEGILGSHFKNHTVHLISDGVKGTTAKAVETPFGKIGTPICFDCDHQDVVRKMTADGAEFFLIPSLDKIVWTERQHLQHGQLFRHRAAENGRWLAIASTSGL
ncbi:hypothetical protein N9192_02235, partial [Akkermansiaceae bacterium]|nr:hypothetical protein [Akkermansiaceae bacterium]